MQAHPHLPAGSLHPGTHTLNSSSLGGSTNINNNNNNNIPQSNNPNDVEYRVTVKQKKKQTAACDACKRRRRKCSGTLPCAYCAEKRCECNYSQQHKRGKRKADANDSPPQQENQVAPYNLVKAQKLWNEAERYSTVDKFCGIRWWWKNLLDVQAIKQSASPAHRAQSSIINAWMARVSRDHAAARHHYDIARNISLNGFGDSDAVSTTTAYILLSDYAPSEKEYNHYSWKSAARIKPGTSTERHVYFYAKCFQACVNDEAASYSERLEQLLSFGSDALQSSVVDLWDTVFFMSIKAYVALMSKLESFLGDNYLRTVSNLSLLKPDRDGLMMDLRVGEVLMQSQIHMFGFEYQTCLHFTKILLLWAGGEREKAVQEAIRYVQNIEQYGENALFLVEVKNLMMPLMILNEAGITAYNNTTVNIIETICKETDQPDMLAELLPLFNELRLNATSMPSPSPHSLNPSFPNSPLSQPRNSSSQPLNPSSQPLNPSSSSLCQPLNPPSTFTFSHNPSHSPTHTPPLSSPSPLSSSSDSGNNSPLIQEIPEHILLENAAAKEFFATSVFPSRAAAEQKSSLAFPPPSSPLSSSSSPSPLATLPPLNNVMYSNSQYSPPATPQASPFPYPTSNSPSPHSAPSSPPLPSAKFFIPPPNYNPPINQHVPSNLHHNHPLIQRSSAMSSFYDPPSPSLSSHPPSSRPTHPSSIPAGPITPGHTNPPFFPLPPSHVPYDLNWDHPPPPPPPHPPLTPSSSTYAELLLSDISSPSPSHIL